nr:hypothetical protein [Niallia taxi]
MTPTLDQYGLHTFYLQLLDPLSEDLNFLLSVRIGVRIIAAVYGTIPVAYNYSYQRRNQYQVDLRREIYQRYKPARRKL